MSFGGLLDRHRRAAGLNYAALAERANLTDGCIGRLVRGERHPEPGTVLLLADALGLGDGQRWDLFAAAGYWPDAPGGLVREPLLVDLDGLLAEAPPPLRDDLRGLVRLAVAAGRTAIAEGEGAEA